MRNLDRRGRGLDKLQRRRAFQLPVKLLQENAVEWRQELVLKSLELLWRADEETALNFEEAIVA